MRSQLRACKFPFVAGIIRCANLCDRTVSESHSENRTLHITHLIRHRRRADHVQNVLYQSEIAVEEEQHCRPCPFSAPKQLKFFAEREEIVKDK